MTIKAKRIEQRKNNRFLVKNGAYTILRYKPSKMGQIINMNMYGLAVSYVNGRHQLTETHELDIFILFSNFYIEKIPVKTISDFKIADKYPFSSKNVRQRCFEFGEMKSSQLFQVNYFLKNYTMKRVSNKDHIILNTSQYSSPEKKNRID